MVGVTLKVEKGNKAIIYSVEPALLQTISGNVPQPKASASTPEGKKIQIPNPVLKAKQANLLVLANAKAKYVTLSINAPSNISMIENASNDDQSQQTSPLTSQITSFQPQSNSQPKSITTPKIKAKPKSAFPSSTTPKTSINKFNAKTKGVQAKPKSIDQKKVSTSVALSGPKKQAQLVERQSIGAILCSHPDLKWTKQLLLATPATAFSLLKQYDNPSKLEQGIRFMQIPELYNHKLIVPFSFVIVNTALKKDVFKLSADHHVTLALFLNAFRPNQIKIADLLQQAANLFPGWSNRWIIFKMMREIESSNQSDSQQTDEQRKDGIQPQSLDNHSTSYVMRNMMTQASKSFLLARAHTLRVFQLLTRRTVDVERVIFHSCKAATNTKIAEDLFRQLSESNPDNPNILRQFSALVRDIHGDKKLAEDILAEAEQVEEEQAKITARLLKQRMDKLKQNKQLIGVNNEDISKAGATHAALAANVFMQGAKIGFSNQGDQHWLQQLDNDSNDNKDNQQDANNEIQRNVLSLSEKMSSAVSYSIYTMFRILSKDSSGELDDEGDSYSIIYQSGFDSTNRTLFEINELFGQVYHYDFNNKMWIDNIVEWNILTFTYPESSVGDSNPIFTITNSTVDNMNIPRFVSWIEDSIMKMVDDFANISQVDQLGIVRTPFTTMKEHFAELLFNQPFVGAESMKRICVIALDDLFSTQKKDGLRIQL
ncbi:MAG: hypothetical protein EZS28_026216 [Streblomastix strix]|uniref:TmcB/TmcC TPR repeats domain-containing protein n=1 Tax=Streblomastix strix TaxID=222440 RepID=A0A5J4V6M7_9EUKA|nr:MAG: hypothetical protein EZS28_026216 [Streblomastix strix]